MFIEIDIYMCVLPFFEEMHMVMATQSDEQMVHLYLCPLLENL